jgi:hypothetical protein
MAAEPWPWAVFIAAWQAVYTSPMVALLGRWTSCVFDDVPGFEDDVPGFELRVAAGLEPTVAPCVPAGAWSWTVAVAKSG